MTLPERLAAFERLAAEAPDFETAWTDTVHGYLHTDRVAKNLGLAIWNRARRDHLPDLLKLAQDQDARIRVLEGALRGLLKAADKSTCSTVACDTARAVIANGERK